MIKISETISNNKSIYIYTVLKNKKITHKEIISFKSFIKNKNNKDYLIIYSPKYKPKSKAFSFLNFFMDNYSLNSRIKSMQALKLLFSFEKIINKKLSSLTRIDIKNLKYFLKGFSPNGSIYEFDLKTTRNNETINSYLSVYRQYAKFLKIKNHALMTKNHKSSIIPYPKDGIDFKMDSYDSNENIPSKVIEVPWYISVDDFKDIISEIRANYSTMEEIIVRLMFQCGLRIGEVLGLTGDDLVIGKIEDKYIPLAYIRNRLSDKKFQNAKTCMNISSKKDYNTKEYKIAGYGFQKTVVPFDLFELINTYIEKYHLRARENKPNIYYSKSVADKIVSSDDVNYYIFLNTQYRPLSSQLWNITLRKIFSAVGITIDKNKRKHNLNHRFRHGFAMYHVKHLKYNRLELMNRMRHSSVASVSKYYKPTLSDSIKTKTDFANSLYELIPSLNEGENNL